MKNLNIYSMSALLLLGAGALSSCSNEELQQGGEGYIQLSSVSLDKSVTTRGDGRTLAVDILDQDGQTFVHADDWTEIQGQSWLVKAGNKYTVKAYSNEGSAEAQGFDVQPYFEGEAEVTVKANTAQTVDVNCKLAQSMVSVSYTEKFKTHMSDYTSEVWNTGIVFGADETRAAYIKSGQQLRLLLKTTPNGYDEREITRVVAEEAKAAYHYKVIFDVDVTGTGSVNVTVDKTIHEYEVTLGIPLKAEGVSTGAINGNYSRVWGSSANLQGFCTVTGADVKFNYRKQGETDWTTINGVRNGETNEYNAQATGLEMGTTYEYQIVAGDLTGDVLTFTTEKFVEIPNLGFEDWASTGNPAKWFPNADANNSYWATGNDGTASGLSGIRTSTTIPTDEGRNGKAAVLTSYTNVNLVGSAAGNLFTGNYATNMSNPAKSVHFGRDYNGARPRKLSGWYKYTPQAISKGTYGELQNDGMDEAHIYVKVYSTAGDHDDNMDGVIGYGEVVIPETATEWTYFEFDINYTDDNVPAASICIMATSSHYGGHFEGSSVTGKVGHGSVLMVDDFVVGY